MASDETEISSLEKQFAALARELDQAAADLRAGRIPDFARLSEEGRRLHDAFRAETERLGVDAASVPELRRALDGVRRAESALESLDRLEHRDRVDSPHLALIRQRCEALRGRLAAGEPLDPAEAEPLVALVELIERGASASLTDEEAGALAEAAARGFGVAVSVSALRGALRLRDATGHATAPSAGPTSAPAVAAPPAAMAESPTPEIRPERPPAPATPSPHDERLRRDFWSVLASEQRGLAYQIARVLDPPPVPAAVVKALVLGLEIQTPTGELASALRETFASILAADSAERASRDRACGLLLAAAALRPALVAWRTLAHETLRAVDLPGPLQQLAETVLRAGERLKGNMPSRTTGATTTSAWEAKRDSLLEETRTFRARASARLMAPAQARDAWRMLASPGGIVHQILPGDAMGGAELACLHAALESLEAEREIDAADRAIRIVHPKPLAGPAREMVLEQVRQAALLGRRWIALHDVRPATGEHVEQATTDARLDLEALMPVVLEELERLEASDDLPIRTAACALREAVEGVRALLASPGPPASEASPADLLGAELLLGELALTDALEPRGSVEEIRAGLVAILGDPVDWATAYQRRAARGEALAAGRVLRRLERTAAGQAEALREAARVELAARRTDLRRDLDETWSAVEEAAAHGRLGETERADLDARLVAMELAGDGVGSFDRAHADLVAIQDALATRRKEETASRQTRLERAALPEVAHGHVAALLAAGDCTMADEYLGRAEAGAALDDIGRDVFSEFFPTQAAALERSLEHATNANADQIVRERLLASRPFAGADVQRARGEEARQAGEMLAGWYEMKRRRKLDAGHARAILHAIGFPPLRAEPGGSDRQAGLEVVGEPIRDRQRVPLDVFGSYANGRYRILGMWEWPSEEALIGRLGDTDHQAATIVFFFDRLGADRRLDLARVARARRRTFIVVDEIALVFLATVRGPRLPALFRVTVPFAHAEPYGTTTVSPEMFFGRDREAALIVQGPGPCFVHGGRQVGKTALLRHVECVHHSPQRDSIVRWLDLKADYIGAPESSEDLWPRLARELVDAGVLRRGSPVVRPERVAEAVKRWLDHNLSRRIRLLLDEADQFLGQDAKDHFRQTTLLRDLTEETEGRFKVVFAGGHGVLRASRLPKHPLGVFGASIPLGPFGEGADAHAARALVEEPLGLLGYRFRSTGSTARLLAHASRDPALVQSFVCLLLRHVAASAEGAPPHWVTPEHLEAVHASPEWRAVVRQHLDATLALDARYEVIAYALAHAVLERQIEVDAGAPASWLREQAAVWWPEGFATTHEDEFDALLEEMVGLGALRSRPGARYAFRDARILLALGTANDVKSALRRDREPPALAVRYPS